MHNHAFFPTYLYKIRQECIEFKTVLATDLALAKKTAHLLFSLLQLTIFSSSMVCTRDTFLQPRSCGFLHSDLDFVGLTQKDDHQKIFEIQTFMSFKTLPFSVE